MSLYELLNKPKPKEAGKNMSLNRTQVAANLQATLSESVVKPYSKGRPAEPLLLKPKPQAQEAQPESRMVNRFNPNHQQEHSKQPELKRPREVSHSTEIKEQHQPIKGKSSELFKQFLRITDIQSADQIRSLETLQRAFKHLRAAARKNELEYAELIEQFKSLRQDLHVQGIETVFTVEVLEFTLQFALRNGDVLNFSKCVGQLQQVCRQASTGVKHTYVALHIIYLVMNRLNREFQALVETLTAEQMGSPTIRKAIALHGLLGIGNFARIQKEYCEGLEGLLMQHFTPKLSQQANKVLEMAITEGTPKLEPSRNLYGRITQPTDRPAYKI